MKRTAFRTMILAAAAVAAVTTVSAQSMKAEIPFPFQAVGARMQAGTYLVSLDGSGAAKIFHIYNQDNRKGILAMPRVGNSPARPEHSVPVLTFVCTDSRCVLASLRDDRAATYTFAVPKAGPGARIATIALKTDRAE
jgi:hypothetical protein